MPNKIISLVEVRKRFSEKEVLNGLSFEVGAGELVALLGRNGAGKTTAINLLLGLEQPDSGQIKVLGQQPGALSVRRQLGVTPQGTDFPEGLKVREVLQWVAAHYAGSLSIEQVVAKFSLTDIVNQQTAGLSYGQKRRIAVALAFIGKPKCVFLDEPTTGLDVQARHALWKVASDYVNEGGTLLLTTHYLEEAERLATKIVVLDQGVVRTQGTVAEVIAASGMPSVVFEAEFCPDDLQGAKSIKQANGQYCIETTDSDALIRQLVESKVDFKHLVVHRNSLEAAFIAMEQSGEAQ